VSDEVFLSWTHVEQLGAWGPYCPIPQTHPPYIYVIYPTGSEVDPLMEEAYRRELAKSFSFD